jgi:hypothetical protein
MKNCCKCLKKSELLINGEISEPKSGFEEDANLFFKVFPLSFLFSIEQFELLGPRGVKPCLKLGKDQLKLRDTLEHMCELG